MAVGLVIVWGGLAGCSDEPETLADPPIATSSAEAAHAVDWLDVDTALSPEQWLASRGEPALRPANDPEVVRVKSLLSDAHRVYRESQRMIANRTVQIEAMLRAKGGQDRAIGVLEDLASIPGEVGQTEGYGAIGQHYVNLRGEGLGREDALAALSKLYGRRSK
jgi:hypothetical protein